MIRSNIKSPFIRTFTNQVRCKGGLYEKYNIDVISPTKSHKNTVIWLHGSGQSSRDLRMRLSTIGTPHTKVVIPNAPVRNVFGKGMVQSWATVATRTRMGDVPDPIHPEQTLEDEGSLEGSRDAIHNIIEHENYLLNFNKNGGFEGLMAALNGALNMQGSMELTKRANIYLAGYETGGAVALYAGLTHPQIKLSGICSISGYVPIIKKFVNRIPQFQRNQRVHVMNGALDDFVDVQYAEEGYKKLKAIGMGNLFVTVDPTRDHIIENEEWAILREAVTKNFGGAGASGMKAHKIASIKQMVERSSSHRSMGDVKWN